MKRLASTCVALSSSIALANALCADMRPRYGGTLTVQLAAAFSNLDPAETPTDADTGRDRDTVTSLVAETLVRLNAKGEPEPGLALSWQHDADRKRWRFPLRSKVLFHDGKPLTAASVARPLAFAVRKRYGESSVTASGSAIVIQSDRPLDNLLAELALPSAVIFRRTDDDPIIGTGPFRVSHWEPGHRVTLTAFDDYWGGRPYLDNVVINLGARAVAISSADIWELPFVATRRVLPDQLRIWPSPPVELVGLVNVDVPGAAAEALALSIDRAPIATVLTQRRGEPAFSLLPVWLSGYGFLFNTTPDLARARDMVAPVKLSALTLSYPPNDSFARSVAERVALNAHDAGVPLQPVPGSNGNLRLIRVPLPSLDAALDVAAVAKAAGLDERLGSLSSSRPETLYQAERALIEDRRILPLVFLPRLWGLGPRVRNWDVAQSANPLELHLDNVWVTP